MGGGGGGIPCPGIFVIDSQKKYEKSVFNVRIKKTMFVLCFRLVIMIATFGCGHGLGRRWAVDMRIDMAGLLSMFWHFTRNTIEQKTYSVFINIQEAPACRGEGSGE